MKKSYTKPEIAFESFTLSTNIAGDCEVKNSSPTRYSCAYETRDGNIFTSEVDACTVEVNGDYTAGNNTFCYHNPGEDSNLFIS